MKKAFVFIFIFFSLNCATEQKIADFNLGFETYKHNSSMPMGWFSWGHYMLKKDSITLHSGKYAMCIKSSNAENSFGSVAYKLPNIYSGKEIQLDGYIKTKNVKNGFAGLLLRLDKNQTSVAFNNMQG